MTAIATQRNMNSRADINNLYITQANKSLLAYIRAAEHKNDISFAKLLGKDI